MGCEWEKGRIKKMCCNCSFGGFAGKIWKKGLCVLGMCLRECVFWSKVFMCLGDISRLSKQRLFYPDPEALLCVCPHTLSDQRTCDSISNPSGSTEYQMDIHGCLQSHGDYFYQWKPKYSLNRYVIWIKRYTHHSNFLIKSMNDHNLKIVWFVSKRSKRAFLSFSYWTSHALTPNSFCDNPCHEKDSRRCWVMFPWVIFWLRCYL